MNSRREFMKTALTAGAGALLPAVDAADDAVNPDR